MTFHIDNRGVATTPLRKICSGKMLGELGLIWIILDLFKLSFFDLVVKVHHGLWKYRFGGLRVTNLQNDDHWF